MLSEIINIDLHIHSIASKYKDGKIVENSTVEKLEVLVDKLIENKISLCAITDHNRFDYNLYKELKKKIQSNNNILKNNLPGVEFDVILEENMSPCHIICIFDESDQEKLEQLESKMFDVKPLTKQSDAYTLEDFEKILKNIGLNVILIVHQRQGIDNNRATNQSLSGSVSQPSEFLQTGYIDCLEYSKPKVEGIVKNSLRDVGITYPLITGSDCHEWDAYPYHNSSVEKIERNFTKFKCLPTFKGLLMSITSFKTRSNRVENSNLNYIDSFSINEQTYKLSNGLNVIIGDNGSGKSLLTSVLSNKTESYYRKLISDNKVYCSNSSSNVKISSIKQGEIIDKVKTGNLFEDRNYFYDVSSKSIFSTKIFNYFDSVLKYIETEIQKKEMYKEIEKLNLTIAHIDKNIFWSIVDSSIIFEDVEEDKSRIDDLKNILEMISIQIETNHYYYETNNLLADMNLVCEKIKTVLEKIDLKYNEKIRRNKVRGIIKNKLSEFESEIQSKSSSLDIEKMNILAERKNFKNKILDCITRNSLVNQFPKFPEKMDGISRKEYKGYLFCKKTLYHDTDLKEAFYSFCFNNSYSTEAKVKCIDSYDKLDDALSGYSYSQISDYRRLKIAKFIEKYSEETSEISEISSNNDIGNTPGEISLIYYKFVTTEEEDRFNVLIIDQPEDDINPNRIKNHLNAYLNSIKDTKQVILVTHNPLLVVNLDVDNVIYLNKNNNKIEVKSGALEYEDITENYSILDLVKENLDGGYDAIERRLKAYDRD